jgi:predicted acylesterase/phospholipase RssA
MKGGGIKGLAYVGALDVLSQRYQFNWFIGTSAGAIAAVLLGAGFRTQELEEILKSKDFGDFFDAKWYQQPLNLMFYKGLHKADTLTEWLDTLIATKLALHRRPKLSDLPLRVTVYASQRFRDALEFDRETNDVYASYAAHCSMSIPYVFIPQSNQGFFAFDGGIRHNYPVEVLLREHPGTPFISLYLGPEVYEPVKETTVIGVLLSIITEAADAETIEKYREYTVIIDPHPIGTLDFTLSQDEKELLLQAGRVGALAHLATDAERLEEERAVLNRLRETVQLARDEAAARRRKRRRTLLGAIAGCLVLAGGWRFWPRPRENSSNPSQSSPTDSVPQTIPPDSASTGSADMAVLEGDVRDAVTRKPLAGVTLTLQDYYDVHRQTPKCHTDANGRYQFRDLRPSKEVVQRVRLVAQKEGYVLWDRYVSLGTTTESVGLQPMNTRENKR